MFLPDLALVRWLRLTSDFLCSFCLSTSLQAAGIAGVHHHIWQRFDILVIVLSTWKMLSKGWLTK